MTLRWFIVIFFAMLLSAGFLFGGDGSAEEPADGAQTVNECVALGRERLAEGKADEAVEILRQAAERYPESQGVLYFLAGAYFAAGETERALESLQRRNELSAESALQRMHDEHGDSLATTVEKVIDKHLEAIGGRDGVSSIETMVVKFTANSTAGNMATIRRMYKRPFYYRQEVIGSSKFVATDGKTVWRVADGNWQEVDEPSYRRMSSIDDYFTDYEDAGIQYEFIGAEIFADTPVYHLKRIFWDGVEQDLYFSIDTGVLTEVGSEYPGGNPTMYSVMSFWDYRDVGGLRIPHVFIRNVGVLGPPHGGVVQSVRVNIPLEDSLFIGP